MPVFKCGMGAMYATATVTCILLGEDLTSVVFNQKELRLHLVKMLEASTLSLMLILKPAVQQRELSKNRSALCFVFVDFHIMVRKWFHAIHVRNSFIYLA